MQVKRLKAATLAIGTEVTDGQILDRNSAILSKKVSSFGFDVIEHRAVPDDHALITRALREMTTDADQPLHVLFVTGGLGPTSDDFTRDVLASFFKRELDYDTASWTQIEERLTARGIAPREIQKQQCYFPRGSQILFNPAGTANGFMFTGESDQNQKQNQTRVIVLPGPPAEIEAIWDHSLKAMLQDLVPMASREELLVWQCLGRGESEIAELVEPAVEGSGLRLGYRVHLPYVEVKVWAPFDRLARASAEPYLIKLRSALRPWTFAEGESDAAVDFLKSSHASGLRVVDQATQGLFSERLASTLVAHTLLPPLNFEIHTLWDLAHTASQSGPDARQGATSVFTLQADLSAQVWHLSLNTPNEPAQTHTIEPTHRFKIESERGRRYVTEMALLWVNSLKS